MLCQTVYVHACSWQCVAVVRVCQVAEKWPVAAVHMCVYVYESISWKLDQRGCRFPDEIKIKLKHETF